MQKNNIKIEYVDTKNIKFILRLGMIYFNSLYFGNQIR